MVSRIIIGLANAENAERALGARRQPVNLSRAEISQ